MPVLTVLELTVIHDEAMMSARLVMMLLLLPLVAAAEMVNAAGVAMVGARTSAALPRRVGVGLVAVGPAPGERPPRLSARAPVDGHRARP